MRADGRRCCLVCKSLFSPRVHGRRKYCSDKCSVRGREKRKTCKACLHKFVTVNRNTESCSPECRNVLRERGRAKYLEELRQKKARRRRGTLAPAPAKNSSHLDSVRNPFAGALSAEERAALSERLDYIRSYKATMGASMGEVVRRSTRPR